MDGGGAQRDAILLANGLAARGWRIDILTLQPDGPLRALIDPAISLVQLSAGSLKAAIPAFRRAFAKLGPGGLILSSEAAQNVVAFLAHASLLRAARPKLLLREVTSPSIARTTDPYLQNRLAYRVIGAAYARCDRTIVLTQGARDDLAAHFGVPAANIEVMGSNAVLEPASERRLRTADLEAGRERGLIVSLGRLSPEKDQLLLVEAFAKLPEGLGARLVLVGDGPLRAAIEQSVARLGLGGRVTLAGFQPDPFAWAARAQLLVCSSRFEGLGNALIEALACGTPVVSTDCPFGPREILRAGAFGRLVPPQDAGALALAMAASLGSTPDRRALQARAFHYTADAAAREFERIAAGLV
jgi:glycosyltransferase involved in cell wall biosynthesis